LEHHEVRVHPSTANLAREDQLAWKLADYAASQPAVEEDVADMVRCRVVDNAAVALAGLNRGPVVSARAMVLAHPRNHGATLFGLPSETTIHAEWAAWANGTAVRELDFTTPSWRPISATPATTSPRKSPLHSRWGAMGKI